MSIKVSQITNIIEQLAPISYAYKWDNIGLQVGSNEDKVNRILTTLEITEDVLCEAIEKDVQMIITHHPLIFSPLKKIIKEDIKGKLIYKAIQSNIAIYAVHTNIDIAPGGLNDYIANRLNIKETEVLDVTEKESYYKLVTFIPVGYENEVAEAISTTGAGHIGNYSHCTFRTNGTGTFKPLIGTNPFIGTHGKLEKVEEVRLETIVSSEKLSEVLKELVSTHPYEEVAYDIYPLGNKGPVKGIGRIGKLEKPKTLENLIEEIKEQMKIKHIKVAGDLKAIVENVAVINGSGADLIQAAVYKNCQCVITGDVKYHDAQDAIAQGINVIDIGHYHSEKFFAEFLNDYLEKEINKKGLSVDVIASTININPLQTI